MESVGFKEWALVCEALGSGAQSILLRKGGIAEGRAGFQFREREFFLFPTFFHEQAEKTRLVSAKMPERRAGEIEIHFFARLESATVVTRWETALALEPWHILTREVVRERFDYDAAPGIHVALVRVYRLAQPWILPELPAYGGCRSWLKLPSVSANFALEPVLSDDAQRGRREEFQRLISGVA